MKKRNKNNFYTQRLHTQTDTGTYTMIAVVNVCVYGAF